MDGDNRPAKQLRLSWEDGAQDPALLQDQASPTLLLDLTNRLRAEFLTYVRRVFARALVSKLSSVVCPN